MTRRRLRWRRSRPSELDCRDVREIMHAYLDGELDPADAAGVSAHLHRCEECGIEAETLREVLALLAAQRRPVDPTTLARLRDYSRDVVEDAP